MDVDPHNPQPIAREEMAIDSAVGHRTALAGTIRQFLSGKTSAFEFDSALDEYRDSSDPAVQFVVAQVWYFYDDCDDHLVVMGRNEWDYFQRLLLLLTSDCKLETRTTQCWSWTQAIAAVCLVLFAVTAARIGWGQHLLLVSIPFGVISIFLSRIRQTPKIVEDPLASIIHPFATFGDLRRAFESVHFAKSRYPKDISHRRIRSPFMERCQQFQLYVAWLLFAPVPLVIQVFPRKLTSTVAKVA